MKRVRPLVQKLHAYVPGEQPRIKGLIKLNTNENPYPPSPEVLAAVKAAVDGRLRLYPNPTAQTLREKLARLHECAPENIIVGNGCDDILAMACRAFVEPLTAPAKPRNAPAPSRSVVQFFDPSYSLYPVLAAIHGAHAQAVPLAEGFALPSLAALRKGGQWDFGAALTFVTTPNAPSGRGYRTAELELLCRAQKGVTLLDETYVDFAEENAMALALKYPHVLVARTFSKSYSLCFQRVGYCIGHPELIGGLHKIRDSYNVNGLGQIAAVAALDDPSYYQANFRKICATRERLSHGLTTLGFRVCPSQANFIFTKPSFLPAEQWLQKLRGRKILVRWFGDPLVKDYLRISIGTDADADALLKAMRGILKECQE
jgi:histidinol-phosphate aminotransferase